MNRKRIVRGALIGIPLLVVCVFFLAVIILNTAWFHGYLRSEIERVALEKAGARVDVGSVTTHWTRLGVDLNDVTVHGTTEPAANQNPLLHADHLVVGVHFLPLLRGRVELRELVLEKPIVHVSIDARGRGNLPVPPHPSATNGNTTDEIFDLEIGDCEIRDGEIYYNDRKTPLDAEFHNLKFNAGYGFFSGGYKGSLSYDGGRLLAGHIGPVTHALQLQFNASRDGLTLDPLVVSTDASRLLFNGRLTNYESSAIEGSYDGSVSTAELARALHSSNLPIGNVSLNGKLAYQADSQETLLRGLILQGQAHSDKLDYHTNERPVAITKIDAQYSLQNATLQVRNLNAHVLGGHARGNYEMAGMDASSVANTIDVAIQGISLGNASVAFAPPNVQRIPFNGAADLSAKVSWAGSVSKATAQAKLTITSRQQSVSQNAIPVNGFIQANYNGPQNTISFDHSHLQTANTKVDFSGALSAKRNGNSQLTVLAKTADLNEVGDLASMIQGALITSPQQKQIPALGGAASLSIHVTGAARDPKVQGQLAAQNLSVDGSHWAQLALTFNADSSKVAISDDALTGSANTRVTFSGRAGLRNWSLVETSPLEIHAAVSNMPVVSAEEIAQVHYPITGILNANLNLAGTRAAPEGTATLVLAKATAWNEPIQNLTLNAQSHGGTIHSTVNLQVPAGSVTAGASYTLATQQYDVKLHGDGIKLEKIELLQKRGAVQGTADLNASGTGTIHDPQLKATFKTSRLQAAGQQISDLDADVNVANQRADLSVRSVIYRGSVEAKAEVALTGDHETSATLDVRALPIAAVAANFFPSASSKIGGQTEIHFSASGPLSTPAQVQAHLEIPSLDVTYGKAQLSLTRALVADYRGGSLSITPTQIQGTGTNLTFGGTVPIESNVAYSLVADGTMDLGVVQQFAPGVKSSGQMEVHIHSAGRSSGMQGQLQIKDAVFTSESSPVGIEGVNAQINISGTRADIANFSGTAGGGQISAHGFVDLGKSPDFSLGLNANSVRVRYPEGLRSILSGQINLQGSTAGSSLSGRVTVDDLSFTQAFDLANFANDFSEDSSGGTPSAFEQNMQLSVAVLSSQDINLASSKVSLGGSANLHVVGTLARPVILGRIALSNGEVFFLSKRFEVQSGTIEFANPARTEPVLHMFIDTTIEQYNITLNLTGPVDRLRTNYTSDPALPPADIIHLLAFGNTNEEAQSQPSQSAAMGAESVLAQGVGSQVAGKLENLTGISQLTIDPLATNSSGDPGAQIAIQERVTGSLLFTFSSNVTTTQGQTVELQYDLNKRTSVTVLRDQNGGYGIDVRLHKNF